LKLDFIFNYYSVRYKKNALVENFLFFPFPFEEDMEFSVDLYQCNYLERSLVLKG